ncbi:MAG TPA: hypothetical protein VF541_00125, partial [Longimicrobium sp.]
MSGRPRRGARLDDRAAGPRPETPAPPSPVHLAARDDAVVVRPRLAPEGMTDLVAALGASLVIFAELLVLPALACAAVGAGNPGAWAAGVAVLMAELAAALLTAVHWLKLDARGI